MAAWLCLKLVADSRNGGDDPRTAERPDARPGVAAPNRGSAAVGDGHPMVITEPESKPWWKGPFFWGLKGASWKRTRNFIQQVYNMV